MAEGKMWTEAEIRDLIQVEVSTGQTMQVLNSAITSGELNAVGNQVASATFAGFEAQAVRATVLAAEMVATKTQIDGILKDCRTFVQQTQEDSTRSRTEMAAEVNSPQSSFQDVVKFVSDVPDTVAALQAKLDSISDWSSANHLDAWADRGQPCRPLRAD